MKIHLNETAWVAAIPGDDNPKKVCFFLCITAPFYYCEPFVIKLIRNELEQTYIEKVGIKVMEKMIAEGKAATPVRFNEDKSRWQHPKQYLGKELFHSLYNGFDK